MLVWKYLRKTDTGNINYSDFAQATRSKTNALPFANGDSVLDAAASLLATVYPIKRSVRLLGVTLSSLTNEQNHSGTEQPQSDFNQ